MENLIFSLNATIPVFLLMVLGYILRCFKLTDDAFVKTLNAFNYKITLPVLLFRDISESDFYSVWDTSYVLYCFLVTLFCITVIWLLTFTKTKPIQENLYRLLSGAAPRFWAWPLFRIFTATRAWLP